MATVKVVSLAIRTLAKPISNKLKQQAQEHETFRNVCINIAQFMHRYEMRMRVNLLGESTSTSSSSSSSGSEKKAQPHIRALSETKAIATGATFISEAFLFTVAVSLILGESYRGYRKDNKRRDLVEERFDALEAALQEARTHQTNLALDLEKEHEQRESVYKILQGVIDVGMKSSEMRRILAHDPDIAKAMAKIEHENAQIPIRNSQHEAQPQAPTVNGTESAIPSAKSVVAQRLAGPSNAATDTKAESA